MIIQVTINLFFSIHFGANFGRHYTQSLPKVKIVCNAYIGTDKQILARIFQNVNTEREKTLLQ